MAVGTVLSRLTGFGRVLALAYGIGFNHVSDAYTLANTTPNIVYELVLGGILSATLIPVFVRAHTRRAAEDEGAVDAVVTVTGVVLAGLAVLFALAAPLIIGLYTAGNHDPAITDQRATAIRLLILFAPQVAAYGVITLATALLNARHRFAAPMWTPIINNLIVIVVLAAFPTLARSTSDVGVLRHDSAGLLLLGLGTTAGVVAQAVALVVSARRAGIGVRWRWEPRHPAVRHIVGLSGWTMGFVIANQVAVFVVILLANRGPAGDLAAYASAQQFFVLPHAVFTVSVMSALLPSWSGRWASGDLGGLRRDISHGLRVTLVVIVPAAVAYVVLARPMLRLVLEHGALSGASARTTADVLTMFALGLPGFSAYLLLSRAFNAMHDTRSLFFLYLLENGINVGVALVVHPRFGVAGLAASYSLAYTVAAVAAGRRLAGRLDGLDGAEVGATLVRVMAAAAALAALAGAVSWLLREATGPMLLVRLVGAGTAGGVAYVVACAVLGVDEVAEVGRTIGRRFARRS